MMSEGDIRTADGPCPHLWITANGLCVCGERPAPKHEHRLTIDSAGQHVCLDCHEIVFVPVPKPEVVVVEMVDDSDDDEPAFPMPLPELLIRMYWASEDGDYEWDVPVSWYVDTTARYVEAHGASQDYDIWNEIAGMTERLWC